MNETNQHPAAAKARPSLPHQVGRRTPPQVRSTGREDLQLRVGHRSEGRDSRKNGELGEHRCKCKSCRSFHAERRCATSKRAITSGDGGRRKRKEREMREKRVDSSTNCRGRSLSMHNKMPAAFGNGGVGGVLAPLFPFQGAFNKPRRARNATSIKPQRFDLYSGTEGSICVHHSLHGFQRKQM